MADQKGYIIKDREQSAVAESFRALRANILAVPSESPLQTILFASASRGGGPWAAANAAVTLAYAGKKVILIDADLRNPVLQEIFELKTAGLTDIIQEDKTMTAVLQASGIDHLSVLTSGPLPAKPFEMLSHEKVRAVVEEAKTMADYVILNSSPLIVGANEVVSDACVLAAKADGIILVMDTMEVRAKSAQKVAALLRGTRKKMIGVVLNNVKDDKEFVY